MMYRTKISGRMPPGDLAADGAARVGRLGRRHANRPGVSGVSPRPPAGIINNPGILGGQLGGDLGDVPPLEAGDGQLVLGRRALAVGPAIVEAP